MNADQIIGLIMALMVMLIGLVGTMIPGIPGTPLILIAAIGHRLWFGAAGAQTWVLIILVVLAVFSIGIDFLATTLGAKKLGATWRGMVGAGLGAIAGLFFPPIGLVIGPLLGATLMEAGGGREWLEAWKAGLGATLGLLAGAVGKFGCCFAMIGIWLLNILWPR